MSWHIIIQEDKGTNHIAINLASFTIYIKEHIQLLSLLLHGSDGWMYFACMELMRLFPLSVVRLLAETGKPLA